MGYNLPQGLGLGILNPKSIFEEDGFTFALYTLFGKPVHEIGVNDGLFQLTDIFENKRTKWTCSSTLERTCRSHFLFKDYYSSKNVIINALSETIKGFGNFYTFLEPFPEGYFEHPENPQYGRFLVRVPVPPQSFGLLKSFLEKNEYANYIEALYPNYIKVTEQVNGKISNNYYLVAHVDFLVPSYLLGDICLGLVSWDLITPNRLYQTYILPFCWGLMKKGFTFLGSAKDNFLEFDYPFANEFQDPNVYYFLTNKKHEFWTRQYNEWQNSLSKIPSSFHHSILPFILKRLFLLGYSLNKKYDTETFLYNKISVFENEIVLSHENGFKNINLDANNYSGNPNIFFPFSDI